MYKRVFVPRWRYPTSVFYIHSLEIRALQFVMCVDAELSELISSLPSKGDLRVYD